MNLIDLPFEEITPQNYDRVITELQAAKHELVEVLHSTARFLGRAGCPKKSEQCRVLADKYEAKP